MSVLLNVFRSLPKLLIASLTFCVAMMETSAHGAGGGHGGGGHGGGGGHVAGFHGGGFGHGFHGGHGFYGYGYPYGFYGFGLGLGLGYGLGYGYGYPYYGYGYPYYDGGYYYGGYPYYSYPYYGAPYGAGYPPLVTNPAPGTTSPNGAAATAPDGTPPNALPIGLAGQLPPLPGRFSESELGLIVRVPADATVWVNGVKTTQSGTRREFNSTGLEPGRSYTFHVRAQWKETNGKVVETNRRITVQAGERRSLDFMSVPALPTAVTSAPAVAKP